MSNPNNSRIETHNISKSLAKTVSLDYIAILREFARELYRMNPKLELDNAILELDEIENRIKGSSNPLKRPIEVDAHFEPLTNQIIQYEPVITPKLLQFWQAHVDIATLAVSQNKSYEIKKYADKDRKNILLVNNRYLKVAETIQKNSNDEIAIYSLFYVHILRTEVIEYSFVMQFKELLKQFNLIHKYDPEEIFSVTNKIGKSGDWRTDSRIIRNLLAHNNYELKYNNNSWEIKFDDKTTNFNKIFTKTEFLRFIQNTDLLYKSTLMLIFNLIARTIIKQHLLA